MSTFVACVARRREREIANHHVDVCRMRGAAQRALRGTCVKFGFSENRDGLNRQALKERPHREHHRFVSRDKFNEAFAIGEFERVSVKKLGKRFSAAGRRRQNQNPIASNLFFIDKSFKILNRFVSLSVNEQSVGDLSLINLSLKSCKALELNKKSLTCEVEHLGRQNRSFGIGLQEFVSPFSFFSKAGKRGFIVAQKTDYGRFRIKIIKESRFFIEKERQIVFDSGIDDAVA